MSDVPVKERILIQLVKNIEAMNEIDNGIAFEFVTRYAQDSQQQNLGNSIAVLDGNESFVYQTAYLQCTMQVGFEYTVDMRKGDIASERLGFILAALKKVLLSNPHMIEDDTNAQLTENVRITDYLPETPGENDDVVQAFAQFEFLYRENKENPFMLM